MNAPGKSHLKRKIAPAKSEPRNKSTKVSDETKEIKLTNMKKVDLVE